jgi:hypothetical protein
MNALYPPAHTGDSLDILARFLRESGLHLSPRQATAAAIEDWIAKASERTKSLPVGQVRGYQWKCLFLPELTELRMCCASQTFYARVEGDDIMYGGQAVSPRQLTLAVAGDGRNAWRDLWIRFPGESKWKSANALRLALKRADTVEAVSPFDAMTAAAASMAGALKTALAFVEHANAQALAAQKAPQVDRRQGQSRRTDDVLAADTCIFD